MAEKTSEPSTLYETLKAGAEGAASPSLAAKIAGGIAPPGAKEAAAQGLQAGANMAVAGSKGFMEATVRQHGRSHSVVLNEQQIKQEIAKNAQPGQNKGIEAFRQKEAANQKGTNAGQSTNQGLKNFQSKASGQTASSSKSGASEGQSKGGQER